MVPIIYNVFSRTFFSLTQNENRLKGKGFTSGNEQNMKKSAEVRKFSVLLDCPAVSSKEFVAIDDDDDNVYTAPIMQTDILEFVQSSRNIIDADSDVEN
ncbi:hypothetical protein TNCV_3812091 [Trichonephila clavipes]|nr:hypothetical protein TNCV_3812091 [Trichonephila clavipes]